MRILKYFTFAVLVIAVVWCVIRYKNPYQVISGEIFGTYYTIKVKSSNENKLLQKSVKEELSKVNQEMSVFDLNSEISNINRTSSGEWIDLSPELQNLLKTAYKIYQLSNGAFDPTTGRLVDLWGFGSNGSAKKIPDEDTIKEVLASTGFNKVKFNADYSRMRKDCDDIIINLSAIAKGYAVDRTADLLKSFGYKDFVIEIGGEVTAFGARSENAKGWNIGIAYPAANVKENAFIVTLKDYSAATSGDYRNFFYIDDKKYSHTIDPKTGYPVDNNLVSVTVFDKSCMIADATATAIMSMGEKKSADFIRRNKLAVVMFVKDENNNIVPIASEQAVKLGAK